MITFRFSLPDHGEASSFTDVDPALLFCQDQLRRWTDAIQKSNGQPTPADRQDYAYLSPLAAWRDATAELVNARDRGRDLSDSVVAYPYLLVFETATAEAILHVLRQLGRLSAHYAALSTGIGQGTIDWTDTLALAGILLFDRTKKTIEADDDGRYYHASSTGYIRVQTQYDELSNSIKLARAAADDAIAQLRYEIDQVSQSSLTAKERLDERWNTVMEETGRASSLINEQMSSLQEEITKSTKDANDTIQNWLSAQMEQRQIAEPARLWHDRATTHANNAQRLKWLAIVTGVTGLPACATILAKVFSIVGSRIRYELNNIEPSSQSIQGLTVFHYQLLVSGAAMLVLLTMYLWAIRLIIRIYTTEHHLAIDASARGAMNQTYLGLIAAGAANEQDRQIVLSALFRPVQDGIVKDDGMPLTGPSTALANLVSANK